MQKRLLHSIDRMAQNNTNGKREKIFDDFFHELE